MQHNSAYSPAGRFEWLDSVRGLAVLWIAFFHCILSYNNGRFPSPLTINSLSSFVEQCAQGSLPGKLLCAAKAIVAAILLRGSQGVGVFLLFSGFGLTYSLVKSGGFEISWANWYKRRLTRLFPVYWLAHLILLISPFAVLHDKIDYRFLLSFFGDRVYPVDEMFFYLVPAWWFLGMLIEFYIAFPLLFKLMQRLGWVRYLMFCIVLTSSARYLMQIIGADGNYMMGAFFVCRLWEFAAGMALGKLMTEAPDATFRLLLSWKGFFLGVITYVLGFLTYQPNFLFNLSDGFTAMGLSVILIHAAYHLDRMPWLGRAFALAGVYSYSIYLFHQPYVIFAGEMLRPCSFAVFLVSASAVIVLISLVSMSFEYAVNRAVKRFFR
ncbi:MAG: acyltransferase [Syntrophobacteraceae bacterium]|jgi:peptidoglycan/LPS O-acetylase OafA/YrhL